MTLNAITALNEISLGDAVEQIRCRPNEASVLISTIKGPVVIVRSSAGVHRCEQSGDIESEWYALAVADDEENLSGLCCRTCLGHILRALSAIAIHVRVSGH